MVKKYTPRRGDAVWINMNPQSGREQAGRRPALILSPQSYNKKVGLALMCPITSKQKGYPFEVEVVGRKVKGVILSDQVKSLDWRQRETEFIESVQTPVIKEVLSKLNLLLED